MQYKTYSLVFSYQISLVMVSSRPLKYMSPALSVKFCGSSALGTAGVADADQLPLNLEPLVG